MTLQTASTTSPPPSSPESTLLTLTRLFARLEHNLLAPSADLGRLRKDAFQLMRVGGNIEYARTTLQTLEKQLPVIKPAERRHGIQEEVVRLRGVLGVLKGVLGGLEGSVQDDEVDTEEEEEEGEDLLDTPEEDEEEEDGYEAWDRGEENEESLPPDHHTSIPASTNTHTATATDTATDVPTTTPSQPDPDPTPTSEPEPSTLRNRHHPHQPPPPASPTQTKEQTQSAHLTEQETLTTSLLSMATQLKTSTQNFQTQLNDERSILSRAVDGIDRTASNMDAAERRMGLLRKMTEGKGWWGRMMLYAWIFAGWVLAILIVFVGPKNDDLDIETG